MADSKYSALPAAATLTGAEIFAVAQAGNSVRTTVSAVQNNALGIYTAPGIGAVAQTVSAKLAQTVSVLDFGADPTAGADSTAAMQAAHNTGFLVYYPKGIYKFSDNITITSGGIIGDGSEQTVLQTTSTNSNNCFNYTGALAGRFENFKLQTQTGYGQKAGGYGIAVGPASGENSAMRFWQVVFSNIPNCINLFRASLWSVLGCNFYNFIGIGINIDNQNNGVSGDAAIQACIFQCPLGTGSTIGIKEVSSGGIKVVCNKFNNLDIGFLLDLGNVVGNTGTSDLVINGNSIEGCTTAGILLRRQVAVTTTFQNVNIVGNQFYLQSVNGYGIYSSDTSGFLATVTIAGNVLLMANTSTNGTGILLNYVTNALAADNVIQGNLNTTTGILFGGNSILCKIGINQIETCQRSVVSGAGTQVVPSDLQTSTTNVTTSTALGSLFSGTGTITFPTAFSSGLSVNLADCSVYITAQGGGGGIAAYPISVSQSQLFFGVSGVTNGGSVPVRWSVKGVL